MYYQSHLQWINHIIWVHNTKSIHYKLTIIVQLTINDVSTQNKSCFPFILHCWNFLRDLMCLCWNLKSSVLSHYTCSKNTLKSINWKWVDTSPHPQHCTRTTQTQRCSIHLQLQNPHTLVWSQFKIKIPAYQCMECHYKDEVVSRLSYVYNGNPYTGKTVSLYWNSPMNCSTERD